MRTLRARFRERVCFGWLLATVLCFLIISCATQSTSTVARNFLTKEAYERADPRLKRAKIGMTFDDFATLMGLKLMITGGKVTAVFADGWLTEGTESWVSGQAKVNEYIFGYMDEVNVVKKAVARFENKVLASIRFFESKGPSDYSPVERQSFTEANVEHLYSQDAYSKAAGRAKGLKAGMDYHTFQEVMNLVTVLGQDGGFYFVGQGLLPELAEQGKPNPDGPHRLKKVYFGYRDNNRPIPKILIEFEDGKISAIHWL